VGPIKGPLFRIEDRPGFGLAELIVVMAVLGLLGLTVAPSVLNFVRAQRTEAAARQLTGLLHQARQLAIARNAPHRVEVDLVSNRLRLVNTTTLRPWLGPGTDAFGFIRLENGARLAAVTASPTFNPLGTAGGGTITVRNAEDSSTLNVVVSPLGRIRRCMPGPGCP
jgi:prepilin-type N-terminal cleavage/methylation domain-containing protein